MYVQFTDSSETAIIAIFGCAQDPKIYPNQGEIETSDPRYGAYYESLPAPAQKWIEAPSED
ncbi:hypothetical protein [Burkholderia glumae]|uniref:hypothetical protein n=1 Tax=Burkholderia glumae TaxID=337 RepID=UPI002150D822|nr:hypothetical protein [Burkholderia glumae]